MSKLPNSLCFDALHACGCCAKTWRPSLHVEVELHAVIHLMQATAQMFHVWLHIRDLQTSCLSYIANTVMLATCCRTLIIMSIFPRKFLQRPRNMKNNLLWYCQVSAIACSTACFSASKPWSCQHTVKHVLFHTANATGAGGGGRVG